MNHKHKYKILLIESEIQYAEMLGAYLSASINADLFLAETFIEAEKFCGDIVFDIAITNIDLPDSDIEKLIDLTLALEIPTIAITRAWSRETQEFIWTKKLADYVVIEGTSNIEYISDISDRIIKNRLISILVVDDSRTSRSHIKNILEIHKYKILEAENGEHALEILNCNPDIKLVLTNYIMPKMDGFELTRRIRQTFNMNEVSIIGISSEANHTLSLQFIKYGANDFLSKPFLSEQLFCRISQNIKIIEQYEKIKILTLTDPLTNIHNRRFFFEVAPKLYGLSFRNNNPIAVAMLDIDHFKNINDSYGHNIGDTVIKTIAGVLRNRFRETDVVARFGGEEFCVFLNNSDANSAFITAEELRKKIEKIKFKIQNNSISVTISIGICSDKTLSLNDMIKQSDQNLYKSKETGRNKTTIS